VGIRKAEPNILRLMGRCFRAASIYSETPRIAMILSGFLEKKLGMKSRYLALLCERQNLPWPGLRW
jgi:hypothetical protein